METGKLSLIRKVTNILKRANFAVSEEYLGKSCCFDLAAKRDPYSLLIKVLLNIDTLNEIHAKELKLLSKILSASPLIIGEKTRKGVVENGVVYERFNIPAVNTFTFAMIMINNLLPLVYARRGGLYVKLDYNTLREIRMRRNLSLGELADLIGVSRKTIYEYERGSMDSTLLTAAKLEEILNIPLSVPIDIFSWEIEKEEIPKPSFETYLERIVQETLAHLGLEVIWTSTTPFNAVARDDKKVLITGVASLKEKQVTRRIKIVGDISRTINRNVLFVVEKKTIKRERIEGVPIIDKDELKKINEPEKLFETVLEHCDN
ncbi:MAG: transcriptional regulator [Candidatus Odinarchaeia archaeon]